MTEEAHDMALAALIASAGAVGSRHRSVKRHRTHDRDRLRRVDHPLGCDVRRQGWRRAAQGSAGRLQLAARHSRYLIGNVLI